MTHCGVTGPRLEANLCSPTVLLFEWISEQIFLRCYRGHGNINFSKISLLANFNPKPITGVNFTSMGIVEDYQTAG